ncbi:class I SAM-dependent methyltransferase [Tessaracoccus defluvii]|uniref:class I SAM-dependent methyltransferase n=1 Tax=Tessaracoccus defluvii TaxID=1285901 RepID=UPI001D04D9AD|nr:class I SAM-dependent methyltransferase [Tessaracoccus defluvii]
MSSAYGARAAEYIAAFGDIGTAQEKDRTAVLDWARGLEGHVIDVGCGPGQWTHLLSTHGVEVEGIDPTPKFVAAAQQRHPAIRFRIGEAERLGVDNASLGGILAWYSLIHTDPALIDTALAEFARCLRPGGGLAVGFFEGPDLAPFDHTVTRAYYWPLDLLCGRLATHGFTVTTKTRRRAPGVRPHGFITAEMN